MNMKEKTELTLKKMQPSTGGGWLAMFVFH